MRTRLMRKRILTPILLALLFVAADNAFGQRFDPSRAYLITARHSSKCLRVAGGEFRDGAAVVQGECNDGAKSAQWQIISVGDGYYKILANHSRKALDVYGGVVSFKDGVPIIQWDYHDGANQQWKFEQVEGGFFNIIARHSGLSLDIEGASMENGAVAHQWSYVRGPNQQWTVTPVVAPTGSIALPPRRGRFRVTLTGFVSNHDTSEHAFTIDGAGDEVFAQVNFAELLLPNEIVGGLQRQQSLIYGDTSGRGSNEISGIVQAGSASNTGGFQTGDPYPPRGERGAPPPPGRRTLPERAIPMVLWEGVLQRGGQRPNAVIIIPTIWENDNNLVLFNEWQGQVDSYLTGFALNSSRLVNGETRRLLVEQTETVLNTVPQMLDFDRPIGIDGGTFSLLIQQPATFVPAVMFLTFSAAEEAAFSTSNSSTGGRGIVEITYRDGRNYGPGSYTIFLLVESCPIGGCPSA